MQGRHENGRGFQGIELDPAEATLWMHRIENSDYRGRHEPQPGKVSTMKLDIDSRSWLRDVHEGVEVVSTRQPTTTYYTGTIPVEEPVSWKQRRAIRKEISAMFVELLDRKPTGEEMDGLISSMVGFGLAFTDDPLAEPGKVTHHHPLCIYTPDSHTGSCTIIGPKDSRTLRQEATPLR